MSTTETTQAPAAAEDKKAKGTEKREYLVLASSQEGVWQEVKAVTATSAEAAIKALGQDGLKETTRYVAVPKRNWQPVRPKVRVQTTISFD